MSKILQRGDGGGVHKSLGGHLDELRMRLGWALGGFAIAFFASLAAGKWFAGVILSPYRLAMEAAGLEVKLQAMQPAEPFLVYIRRRWCWRR